MPLLSSEYIADLLERAATPWPYSTCGCHVVKEYCRTCDEFYNLHAPGCFIAERKHHGHRLTIVPFVEDRGRA